MTRFLPQVCDDEDDLKKKTKNQLPLSSLYKIFDKVSSCLPLRQGMVFSLCGKTSTKDGSERDVEGYNARLASPLKDEMIIRYCFYFRSNSNLTASCLL